MAKEFVPGSGNKPRKKRPMEPAKMHRHECPECKGQWPCVMTGCMKKPAVVCTRCSGFALKRNGEALAYFTTGQHLPQKSLENAPADQLAHVDAARRISGAQEPTPGIAIYHTDLREIMEKIAAENATPDFLEPSYEAFCGEVVRRYVEMHRWR